MADSEYDYDAPDVPGSINQLVLSGEFGFLAVDGPFTVEKDGTVWNVAIPTGEGDHGAPNPFTLKSLRDSQGKSAVLIADGEAVGGGVVTDARELEDKEKLYVWVDQYAMGSADTEPAPDENVGGEN